MKTIRKELEDIVYSDKDVLSGTPCFIGTRVPVKYILEYISLGWSLSEIQKSFPDIKREFTQKLIDVYANDFNFQNA